MASRWAKPAAGLLVTAAFVWLLLRNVDLRGLASSFGNLPTTYLLLAVAFLAAGYAVRIVRWWWMLRALDPTLPLSACVWPFLGSIAVNNTVPFRAGDALRVVAFREQLRAPPMRVLGTLVLERLLDLLVLLALFFAGVLGLPSGSLPGRFVAAAAWLAGGSLVAVSALILLGPRVPVLVRALASRPVFAARGWSEPIHRFGMTLLDALNLLRAPARLASTVGACRSSPGRSRGPFSRPLRDAMPPGPPIPDPGLPWRRRPWRRRCPARRAMSEPSTTSPSWA